MCIQDFTLYHCGCQKKGSLRECGEYQCSLVKDIAKQVPDYCPDCQSKLDKGAPIPQRRTSTIKKIKRTLSMKTGYAKGYERRGSVGVTPEDSEWVNPFKDPL